MAGGSEGGLRPRCQAQGPLGPFALGASTTPWLRAVVNVSWGAIRAITNVVRSGSGWISTSQFYSIGLLFPNTLQLCTQDAMEHLQKSLEAPLARRRSLFTKGECTGASAGLFFRSVPPPPPWGVTDWPSD